MNLTTLGALTLAAIAAAGAWWGVLQRHRTRPSGDPGLGAASRELNRLSTVDARASAGERAAAVAALERDRQERAKPPDDLEQLLGEAAEQRARIESGEEPPK